MPLSDAKMHVKNAPRKLNFVTAKLCQKVTHYIVAAKALASSRQLRIITQPPFR